MEQPLDEILRRLKGPPIIGVSSCLVGNNVRYEGDHRRSEWVIKIKSSRLRLIEICPEVAIGLGVPRPPIELVEIGGHIRAVRVSDRSVDVTSKLTTYGTRIAYEYANFCGYIFKARSPSCGITDVRLLLDNGTTSTNGQGIFTKSLLNQRPYLPTIDENLIKEIVPREIFLIKVLLIALWQQINASVHYNQALIEYYRLVSQLHISDFADGNLHPHQAAERSNDINAENEHIRTLMCNLDTTLLHDRNRRIFRRWVNQLTENPRET